MPRRHVVDLDSKGIFPISGEVYMSARLVENEIPGTIASKTRSGQPKKLKMTYQRDVQTNKCVCLIQKIQNSAPSAPAPTSTFTSTIHLGLEPEPSTARKKNSSQRRSNVTYFRNTRLSKRNSTKLPRRIHKTSTKTSPRRSPSPKPYASKNAS